MQKIYITDYISNPSIEQQILQDQFSYDLHENIEVLLVWHEVINASYMDRFPKLRGIVRYGVGFDNIDLKEAQKRHIYTCNTPDYGTEEVADTAMSMLLNLSRGTTQYDAKARTYFNSWQENRIQGLRRLSTQTLGIIGCGRIGTAVALRAKAFGLSVQFYDPYLSSGYEKSIQIKRCDFLEELLNTSDIISFHTPLTDETKGLINQELIQNMKKESILINTARGQILDHLDTLFSPLKTGHLKGVGLDVLDKEPPQKGRLLQAWQMRDPWLEGRLLINPHTAYFSEEAFIEMRTKAAKNALNIVKNRSPINQLYSLKETYAQSH